MAYGTITKINAYKTNTGYFIGINNEPIDYMFFGALGKEIGIGTKVIFDEGKPKGDRPTIKSIKKDSVEAFIDEDKPRSAPLLRAYDQGGHSSANKDSRESYWHAKELRDIEREPIITRLSCLSSAATIIAAAHETVSKSGVEASTIDMAKKFEAYANGK
jgi:hypothetical protein